MTTAKCNTCGGTGWIMDVTTHSRVDCPGCVATEAQHGIEWTKERIKSHGRRKTDKHNDD